MIYYLFYPLHDELNALNVLRYVPFRALAATMTSLLFTFFMYPWFIRALQAKQIGQVIRKDGPASHFSKAGTPTMGGALILLALVASTVLWADPRNSMVWCVTAVTVLYGVIGYIDDAAKIKKKNTAGLSGRVRLVLEFAIALSVAAYLQYGDGDTGLPADWQMLRDRLAVPFVAFDKHPIVLPRLVFVGFAAFVIVATANAV
ncbi:MAG TPA: phospho-N-acetylmuramoyl-pentapeptide-transferase, partial [Polyangiales bacterium]|nr:phospho-N-acetylmuramoyl-pentapeptide-transferase [Polyangiales bacterium]